MFCKYCGAELADEATFCTNCGKQLKEENEGQEKAAQIETEKQEKNKVNKSKTKKNIAKSILSFIGILILIGGCIVGEKAYKASKIENYKENMYKVYKESENRFNDAVHTYNANRTFRNAERADLLGLDMLDSYLDYYEGMVSVQGKTDYSKFNIFINKLIGAVSNYSDEAKGDYCYDRFNYDLYNTYYYVLGIGDYSNMNRYMNDSIALVEDNHRIYSIGMNDTEFKAHMTKIRDRWDSIKQLN